MPERLRIWVQGLLSKASDVYAFGKILYYMYNNERSSDALEASGGRRISGGKQDLPPFPPDMPAAFEVGEPTFSCTNEIPNDCLRAFPC